MAEKILIVDDDPETVKFISIFLQRQGYEPMEAQNGMEAIQMASQQNPDLIVLDVMMPGLDGYEVARTLRRKAETALIPILMFTAKIQTEDKLEGYEAGVDLYLTKPIHPVELQANIKALLAQRKTRAELLANRGYVVGVLAAKGGLGVSTIALNLAVAYKQRHKSQVIAAETRPGQGSWAEELGIPDVSGLNKLLQMSQLDIGPAAVEKQISSTSFGVPLLLASSTAGEMDVITAIVQYESIVRELSMLSNLLILDIGTSFHPAYEILTGLCDEIVLVTEPQPLTVKRTRAILTDLKIRDFGSAKGLTLITVNRTRSEMTMQASEVQEVLGQPVALGFPPVPELAFQAGTRGMPIYALQAESLINRQFNNLASLIHEHVSQATAG